MAEPLPIIDAFEALGSDVEVVLMGKPHPDENSDWRITVRIRLLSTGTYRNVMGLGLARFSGSSASYVDR
jgi:hypothetical protein